MKLTKADRIYKYIEKVNKMLDEVMDLVVEMDNKISHADPAPKSQEKKKKKINKS